MTTDRTSTMYTRGTHAEKRERFIRLQAEMFGAINQGITGKERGAIQRKCTVAMEQYLRSCHQQKMTREEMDKDYSEIIAEAEAAAKH